MSIYKGSRYENVPVYDYYLNDSTFIPTLRRRRLSKFATMDTISHIWQHGDRIDLLAYKYYGDSQLWWVIMDANPKYMTPWDIKIGDSVFIPPVGSILGSEKL